MPKTALVTGASSGIGAAIAVALAQKGFQVAVGCHSQGSLERSGLLVAAQCSQSGAQSECFVADVASFDAAKTLISDVDKRFGSLDLLVNCAGITRDALIARMSEVSFDDVVGTNLKGAFNTIRHVTPLMMKRRHGSIINIASVVGLVGNAGQANYAASKAGLIGLTKSVAKELGPRGITCNAIAPGYIETAMSAVLSQEQRDALVAASCLRRPGSPEDVARAAVFLAENNFITGQVLVVDGGLSLF